MYVGHKHTVGYLLFQALAYTVGPLLNYLNAQLTVLLEYIKYG